MHPVIRVIIFLILVALLSRATLFFIVALDALFLLLSLPYLSALAGTIWRSILRLRWLWLSLLVLYGFMLPGSEQAFWHWSSTGFMYGLERCLALLSVILYFSLLNHVTTREELQAAICWLLLPLQRVGVPVARLSLRISLTLQAVAQIQTQFVQRDRADGLPARNWRQLPQRIYHLFETAQVQADKQDTTQVLSFVIDAPRLVQWLYLLLIVGLLFLGLNLLSA